MTAQAVPTPAALHQDGSRRQGAPAAGAVPSAAPDAAAEVGRAFRKAIERWLDWQCRMIVGVHLGTVYVPESGKSSRLRAGGHWPAESGSSSVMHGFAEQAWSVRRSVMHKAVDETLPSTEVCDFVAYPVEVNGRLLGVVTLALEIRSEVQRQAVVQLLEWGAVWLENTLLGLYADRREDAKMSLKVVATLASDLPLPVSAHQVCNGLADAFGCSRVALGVVRGMQARVVALSNQVQFERRQEHVARIQAAMEECVDQEEQVCLPRKIGVSRGLTRAHERLLELDETAAACSVPILTEEHALGALTLIWDDVDGVDSVSTSRVADIARQVAPVLALKQREERSRWRRLGVMWRGLLDRAFGAGYLRFKLVVAAMVIVLGAAAVIETDKRVAADALIEGTTQQAIVAPINGFLIAARARAGDQVQSGQVLALIDDRELLVEKQKWQSERDKHAKEYQEALGSRDRAKISIAAAQIAQADAELKLVDDQIARTRLQAPFAGTLVSGDLSRSMGAPLEKGQLLFEIVPSDSYRVGLQVDEHDIAGLKLGQAGDLRLTGMPATPIPFAIGRIVPLATADSAGNRFRVEAQLDALPDGLRPGMQGVAKVVTGRTSLLHAWTDELVDRLRFWLWSLGY